MNRLHNKIVLLLLLGMGIFMYTSAWNDAAIVDENPHIGAGISYLTQQDMRINPEHPPLLKDLAALPLLLIPNLAVPTDHPSWTRDINGQWDFGRAFLFQSGNNADLILRLARLAPILVTLLLGYFVFRWTHERHGSFAAYLALFFFITSPVILAHGRFVTTDVGAAAGIFIATYYFFRYLREPTLRHLSISGVAFGFAQLTKFSVILLVPYFAFLSLLWWSIFYLNNRSEGRAEKSVPEAPRHGVRWLSDRGAEGQAAPRALGGATASFRSAPRAALICIGSALLIGLIGLVIIYGVYAFHTLNYPEERQIADTAHILASFSNRTIANAVTELASVDSTRPLAQYLLGLAMVGQRAAGGNTTFFMGEVSAAGWFWYFPIVYLIKIPFAFHVFTLIAALVGMRITFSAARSCIRSSRMFSRQSWGHLAEWTHRYFVEIAMLGFITLYWFASLSSNLNIGVRHLVPTLPFAIMLVAAGTRRFLRIEPISVTPSFTRNISAVLRSLVSVSTRTVLVSLLFFWLAIAALLAWPSYLSSFNELALLRGGGAAWVVDSNLDWGQDLKRLARFVGERNIDRISIDYFGWTPPEYYIQTAEVVPWDAGKGQPSGWFAVSATYRQQACARAASGFRQDTTGYCFLSRYQPVAVIGGSIYVYSLP